MTTVSRRKTSGQRAAGEGGPQPPERPAPRPRGLAAPLALPAGFAALLTLGAVAAGTGGSVGPLWILVIAGVIVAAGSAVAEPAVAPLLGAIGWLTVVGFSQAPYAQLHMTGALAGRAAITMFACALAGAGAGVMVRRIVSRFTLWIVDVPEERWPPASPAAIPADLQRDADGGQPEPAVPGPRPENPSLPVPSGDQHEPAALAPQPVPAAARRVPSLPALRRRLGFGLSGLFGGIGSRRLLLAGVILVAGLPLLTIALVAGQSHLSLADDLLIYLVAVVGVAVVGGFWPAVLGAVTSSLLLNWYFTRPVHTFTIEDPQNLLALLLFVTVAVTVSSVVHLAAHRALQAARSSEEAAELLALAQTVLGGADTPTAVLDHLTGTRGGRAELVERVGTQWFRVAVSGTAPADAVPVRVEARPGLVLVISAQSRQVTARLLDGFAAQAAAALDRERLRTQAAQAEALAEGNRMRTALLRAVSHDLRTPLASIKASVSTLRQTDVQWTPADEAALLATIEQGADRLDALIGNLLDMSRLSTGGLQPFLRPTAIDEVAPVALRGLDAGGTVQLLRAGPAAAGPDRSWPARAGAGQPVRQRAGLLTARPSSGHAGEPG